MRRRGAAFIVVLALVSGAFPLVRASATPGMPDPGTPSLPQTRNVEPVVLTGSQFPDWSAGPEISATAPTQPPTSSCPADSSGLRHNCSETPLVGQGDKSPVHIPTLKTGKPIDDLIGYHWDPGTNSYIQIPFQVDKKFNRYISNFASNCTQAGPFCVGFGAYAGADQQPSYVYDRDIYKYTDGTCFATPTGGPEQDPIPGLDDNDEMAFLAKDAGAQAPPGAPVPSGITDIRAVRIDDPSVPGSPPVYAYVGLSDGTVKRAYNADNGYMRYVRDDQSFRYYQTSGNYGNAPKGTICDDNGNVTATNVPRRPLDTAWVLTPRYAFQYGQPASPGVPALPGRWILRGVRVNPDKKATKPLASPDDYGPPLVDQWKARAYAQTPQDKTPCCGFETEQFSWGGSSVTLGEKVGPVRVIRTTWGSDSGTNTVRNEIFYPDMIVQQTYLRVHPIPPLGGIFSYWDHTAGVITKYYNPEQKDGVPVDGVNDEVLGNGYVALHSGGVELRDNDPVLANHPVTVGSQSGCITECTNFDVTDPTLNATGTLAWEEVTGSAGSMVFRNRLNITPDHVSPGDAQSFAAIPYYRDDMCFDDGTGTDPGPAGNGTNQRPCNWSKDGTPPPGGWRQGLFGAHGVQVLFAAETDNVASAGTVPVTEIDAETRMVVLPGDAGNVGESYGHAADVPLEATVVSSSVPTDQTSIAIGGDTSGVIGSAPHLSATLTDRLGPVSGAVLHFIFQGMDYDSPATDSTGKATVTVPVNAPAGPNQVVVDFAGDFVRAGSDKTEQFTVGKMPTSLSIDPSSATSGQINHTVTFAAKLADPGAVSGATLHFTFQGATYDVTTDSSGLATTAPITVKAPAGDNALQVAFDGDDVHNPSNDGATISVTKDASAIVFTDATDTTAKVNHAATFATKLTDSAGPVSGATVHFSFQGSSYDATTDASGVASQSAMVKGPSGDTSVTATFDGDGSRTASSATKTFTVSPDDSALRFGDESQSSGTIGDQAHFSGVLTDSAGPVPGGTIHFDFQGATQDATTDNNGVASAAFAVNGPAATSTVVMRYDGDPNRTAASASAPFSVKKRSTKISFTAESGKQGTVAVSVTLTDGENGSGLASKSVDVSVNGAQKATITTNANGQGKATFKLAKPQGKTFGAAFAGDETYDPSSAQGTFGKRGASG